MFSEDLGVPGDWNTKPEFLRDNLTGVEKVTSPLKPEERLARAIQNLQAQDELVTEHNATTGMNGDLESLIKATKEKRLAEEGLTEQKV